MPTPAYVPVNPDKPAGLVDPPDVYAAHDLANVRALRDAVITGAMPNWGFAADASATPTNRTWAFATFRLKLECTYVSNLPATAKWWWSNDSGATYSQIGVTAILSWDAALNLTAVDTNAGLWVMWLAAYTRAAASGGSIAAHAALVGPAVHGLGTLSQQNANGVNITGGTVTNVQVTNSLLTNYLRIHGVVPVVIGSAVWDWSTNGSQQKCAPGTAITNIANCLAGEVKRLWVTGPGAITIGTGGGVTFKWSTGHPVWGATATLVSFVAVENTLVIGTTSPVT